METVTRVEIMRSGHLGRWAAMAGALLLTGACTQATGLAGVSAQSPSTAPATGTPAVTATIPTPSPSAEHQAAEQPPEGEDPVKVPPPKLSKYTYTFPVKGCKTTYQRKLLVLPKTTIWAGEGCAFVAPIGGVVDEVNAQNKWRPSTDVGADREGRFVTIIGDDGVRYLGGHLDTVAEGVKPGVRVKAGQLLGRVGRSGNARDTGPNLYFAISWKTGPSLWWVRRGMVEPWDYLDAWQSGNRTFSPREETLALRGRLGETPRCTVQCSSKKVANDDRPEPQTGDEESPAAVTIAPSPTP
ncbi:M23 family metallopeptidase [Nonomuraea turcica]|uniref:M23 family metallopeptidase n=1 Tax=Nonomuraea sp. G32 TaxID=3067274 RepID=UPI00273C5FAD|nr:peptidoglycan DD-metalloendopeptidase family protein [Nonomuraea sp. G32]MDP4507207.1 peptidoglycan DD-metalloendopeptidase family protein [Nonomuraea sp. G32]